MTAVGTQTRAGTIGWYFAAVVPALVLFALGIESYDGFGALSVGSAAVVNACGALGGLLALIGAMHERRAPTVAGLAVFAVACVAGALVVSLDGFAGSPVWPSAGAWLVIVAVGAASARASTIGDGAVIGAAAGLALLSMIPSIVDYPGMVTYLVAIGLALVVSVTLGIRARMAAERLRAVAGSVRVAERTAMAHELHDLVAHEVAGIAVLAQAGLATGRGDTEILGRIGDSAARALADIRALVDTLRDPSETGAAVAPTGGDVDGLVTAATEFADSIPGTVHVDIDRDGLDDTVPGVVYLAAHRILSESLTNIRRHAAAAAVVDISIRRIADDVTVEVANSLVAAPGSDAALTGAGSGSGSGVAGMIERAASVGGVAAASVDGDRWVVRATLPVNGRTSR